MDFFKPDIDEAKAQLAAVTAMMDDIDPKNIYSPEIIHVVSYSEALYLATPDIINESIKITRHALKEYRTQKWNLGIASEAEEQIRERQYRLERDARKILKAMEENIENLYSPEDCILHLLRGGFRFLNYGLIPKSFNGKKLADTNQKWRSRGR